ncbi:Uu.00g077390.m01.CDS01 [Anthostomella pinea]|uniref:protein disulfide-isomerase n=1 Tax=Anthostomella pinea TaxID=933095 RepID=A0AAI8VW14_9PEZI|nr:Uu.00g077390.m01.CDS01 [Anthostomella pinea]
MSFDELWRGITVCWLRVSALDDLKKDWEGMANLLIHSLALVVETNLRPASQTLELEWAPLAETEEALMSIDCVTEAALCNEHEIVSYPALRFFDGHANMSPYRGPRRASAITSFLKRAARPTVTALSEKKIARFPSTDDIVFVAHLNPQDEHVTKAYKTIASQYRDRSSFGSIETEGRTTIECYNNKDELKTTISDFTAIDALPKFVESCMAPLIGEFTRANEMKYLQSGKSLVYYFATASKEREAFVDSMRTVAKTYKEYLSFVTVDANEYADMTAPLGLASGAFPGLSVQNPMLGQVFPYPPHAKITSESVGAFVMDIVQGKVKPWDGQSAAGSGGPHDEL